MSGAGVGCVVRGVAMQSMRTRNASASLALLGIALSTSCSGDLPPPTKLATVPGPSGTEISGEFNLYVPGSILDSYLTLDIVSPQGTLNLLSSGHCDWIAARIGNQLVEVVLFQARATLRSPHVSGTEKAGPADNVSVMSINHAAREADLSQLRADGYTAVKCEF